MNPAIDSFKTLLIDNQVKQACLEMGLDFQTVFIKPATPENIALIKQTVGRRCLVKAAGGVRDLQTLLALYELGAGDSV